MHTSDPDFIQEIDSTATANIISHQFRVDDTIHGEVLYNKTTDNEHLALKTTGELRFLAGPSQYEQLRIDSVGRFTLNGPNYSFQSENYHLRLTELTMVVVTYLMYKAVYILAQVK